MAAAVTWTPARADDLADVWVPVRSSLDARAVDPVVRATRIAALAAGVVALGSVALALVAGVWPVWIVAALAAVGAAMLLRSTRAGLLVSRRGVRVVTASSTHEFGWDDVAFELEPLPSSWTEWLVVSDSMGREAGARTFARRLAPEEASPGYDPSTDLREPSARRGAALDDLVALLEQMRRELGGGG